MKVLHLLSNYNGRFYPNLLLGLVSQFRFQYVFYPYRNVRVTNRDFGEENIKVIQQPILNFFTRLIYWYKQLLQYKTLKEHINLKEIDIIYAHTLFTDGGTAYLLYLFFGIPYNVTVRITDVHHFMKYKPWLKPLARQILKKSNNVICVTSILKNELVKKLKLKNTNTIAVIPNGIDAIYFKSGAKPKTLEQKTPRLNLIYIGTFCKRKNVHMLIDFVSERNNFDLTIIGGGGDYNGIVLKKINQNLKINYLGFISDKETIINELKKADIFIMPSYHETFGIVYIESISQGTPIIYTKGTGIDLNFQPGVVGFPVKPDEFKEWDLAIHEIKKNYEIISANCISEAMQYDWDQVSAKYATLSAIKTTSNV